MLTFARAAGPTVRTDGAGTDANVPSVSAWGSTAEWAASGHVLGVGELGLDTTTGDLKAGDGVNIFSALSPVNSGTFLTQSAASGTYAPAFVVDRTTYGGGTVDATAHIQAKIQAAYDAGGGTVYVPKGIYRCDSQLTVPNDGASPRAKQPAIRIVGDSCDWNGNLINTTDTYLTGSVLDLRANTAPAKLDTRGLGLLTIEGITFTDRGTSTAPFVQTTNTTVHIRRCAFVGNSTKSGATCDQDAIVLGGVNASSGNAATDAFAGYGSVVERCLFHRIRRGVHGRSRCNSIDVIGNLWDATCGGDATHSAVEFDGTGSEAAANRIAFNTFEVSNYVYAVRLVSSGSNRIHANACWDPGAGFLAMVKVTLGISDYNLISQAYINGHAADLAYIMDPADPDAVIEFQRTHTLGIISAGGNDANIVRPGAATGSETARLFGVWRNAAEAINPGGAVLTVAQNGTTTTYGSDTNCRFALDTVGAIKRNGTGLQIDTVSGQILMVPGGTSDFAVTPSGGGVVLTPATGKSVYVNAGVFRLPRYATASRPAANQFAGSGMLYDTDLNTPMFSNATIWKRILSAVTTGTGTLVGGTLTIADTSITANSVIRLSYGARGGTPGALYVSALNAGVGFTVTSTSVTDTSSFQYDVISY